MAIQYQLKTFSDIVSFCANELKVQLASTEDVKRIKRVINSVYIDEVVPSAQWRWRRGEVDMNIPVPFSTGTAATIQSSVTITLSSAPTYSVQGYWFSIEGFSTRYKIQAHSANSTTLTLEAPYSEETNATASLKIWTDRLVLPVDCHDTYQVTHGYSSTPLLGLGMQKLNEMIVADPKRSQRPQAYSTSDFVDPLPYANIMSLPSLSTRASNGLVRTLTFASTVASLLIQGQRVRVSGALNSNYNGDWIVSSVSGSTITFTARTRFNENATADVSLLLQAASPETADERYRELVFYPSIFNQPTNMKVDYVKEVSPLVEDTDEPLMPISDRLVLCYGALMILWSSIGRNPEEAARNGALYQRKLGAMQGKLNDSTDMPQFVVSKLYLAQKRRPFWSRRGRAWGGGDNN